MNIQRQKQTVNEYLFSNNEMVGRVQKEVNNVCKEHQGGGCGMWEWLLGVGESTNFKKKMKC